MMKNLRRYFKGLLSPRDQPGVALLIVTTFIAIVTSAVMDFAYNSRIYLMMAAHARDEVRAYYLARSAFNFARLVLFYQKQLDAVASNFLGQLQQQMGMNLPVSAGIQLWQIMPSSCDFLNGLTQSGVAAALESGELDVSDLENGEVNVEFGLGEFEGTCDFDITDEGGKINLYNLTVPGRRRMLVIRQLQELLAPRKYDFLFQNRDPDGQYTTREELIGAIVDWIDDKDGNRMFDITFMDNVGGPEDQYYQGLEDPYLPKNAYFDTKQELHLVRGIGDDFFRLFGDRITIYPDDKNVVINWCTADWETKFATICALFGPDRLAQYTAFGCGSGNEYQQKMILELFDRWRQEKILRGEYTVSFGCNVTLEEFQQFADELVGYKLPTKIAGVKPWGTKSKTFVIRAEGEVGTTRRRITAVVNLDKQDELWYYRED